VVVMVDLHDFHVKLSARIFDRQSAGIRSEVEVGRKHAETKGHEKPGSGLGLWLYTYTYAHTWHCRSVSSPEEVCLRICSAP
jgi:hypothetical protein